MATALHMGALHVGATRSNQAEHQEPPSSNLAEINAAPLLHSYNTQRRWPGSRLLQALFQPTARSSGVRRATTSGITHNQRHHRIHSSEMQLDHPSRLNGHVLPIPVLQMSRASEEPGCCDSAAATGGAASASGLIKVIDSEGNFSTSASSQGITVLEGCSYCSSSGRGSEGSGAGSESNDDINNDGLHLARPQRDKPFRRLFRLAGRAIRAIGRRISPQGKGARVFQDSACA